MSDLHPDFFDGETPIIHAHDGEQPRLYRIKAEIRSTDTVYVRAFDKAAAIEEAEESIWCEFGSGVEVVEAAEINIDQIPAWHRNSIIDAEELSHD